MLSPRNALLVIFFNCGTGACAGALAFGTPLGVIATAFAFQLVFALTAKPEKHHV